MKVLVTGAAGFIGSNLVHFLCRERPSWKITALDLLTYAGNLKNIATLVMKSVSRLSASISPMSALSQSSSSERSLISSFISRRRAMSTARLCRRGNL